MHSALLRTQIEAALAQRHPSALTVRERSIPDALPTGVPAVDAMSGIGGVPRGALTELCGPASSGRSSVLLSLLARATEREFCALVDVNDAFDPESAVQSGVDCGRLLWVRCNNSTQYLVPGTQKNPRHTTTNMQKRQGTFTVVEQALKATDLLLQAGGFGLIVVDFGDVPPQVARRVPLTSWFRFRRVVEGTPTTLVVIEQEPFANTCASLVLRFKSTQSQWSDGSPAHTNLLRTLQIEVEASRVQMAGVRKPVARAKKFAAETSWAGPAGAKAPEIFKREFSARLKPCPDFGRNDRAQSNLEPRCCPDSHVPLKQLSVHLSGDGE